MALDAHERPPEGIKRIYKKYQKLQPHALNTEPELLNQHRSLSDAERLKLQISPLHQDPDELYCFFERFLRDAQSGECSQISWNGLSIVPSLLPKAVQSRLLSRLLHRDLSNPAHKTNVHVHYTIPYPVSESLSSSSSTPSFFDPIASPIVFQPLDPTVHKPLSTSQFLNKKLRWMTLGGQYDWTRKLYPEDPPPPFPPDIADLVQGCFPAMRAQAAIVNLYSPGDTLSLHRDVSESCDRPLVSISLGCDGVFVIGLPAEPEGEEERVAVVRLKSGDAVIMAGEARYAWHGVPQIVKGTCPEFLRDWPYGLSSESSGEDGGGERYQMWKGWIEGKRINLNVRQMWDQDAEKQHVDEG
ncbi:hypothetical protein LTR66_003979 [Elasticomyces elasticus]|nr:hypothetical protein LTR66_003979 [Elasticomyces elasticus]